MTACVICGRSCVPMADYDVPVCLDCDERMATVLAVGPRPRSLPGDLFIRIRTQMEAA